MKGGSDDKGRKGGCTMTTVVCVTTYPAICKRHWHHNCFEQIHCFAGGLLSDCSGYSSVLPTLGNSSQFLCQLYQEKTSHLYHGCSDHDHFSAMDDKCKVPIKAEVLSNSVVLLWFEGYIRHGLFRHVS